MTRAYGTATKSRWRLRKPRNLTFSDLSSSRAATAAHISKCFSKTQNRCLSERTRAATQCGYGATKISPSTHTKRACRTGSSEYRRRHRWTIIRSSSSDRCWPMRRAAETAFQIGKPDPQKAFHRLRHRGITEIIKAVHFGRLFFMTTLQM